MIAYSISLRIQLDQLLCEVNTKDATMQCLHLRSLSVWRNRVSASERNWIPLIADPEIDCYILLQVNKDISFGFLLRTKCGFGCLQKLYHHHILLTITIITIITSSSLSQPLGLHLCSPFHPPKLPTVEVTFKRKYYDIKSPLKYLNLSMFSHLDISRSWITEFTF